MCGIAGIVYASPAENGREVLGNMAGAIAHRGPDHQGLAELGNCFLGHRRLSILDLSEAGNQPMQDFEGRYVVVFNGEIYNYREIKLELDGHYPFQTGTDTEVLLAAWRMWGIEAVHKFYGMFAFALWDKMEQKLWLVRDRMGIKPLYYALGSFGLAFASEIRALLASGLVPRKLNRSALGDFLAFQTVSAPETLVQGVKMVQAGHYATFVKGAWEEKPYWGLIENARAFDPAMGYVEVRSEVRRLLEAAVARRLVSDVPLGAFLSGGIDSSSVVALMARASSGPVDTFSIGFEEKEFDESDYARRVAQKFGTRHHPIRLQPTVFLDELEGALQAMDHPSGDGPNSYVVSKATKAQGVTVALSGLGGDELFAGYPFFTQMASLQKNALMKMPLWARKMGAGVARIFPGGRRGEKIASVLSLPGNSLEHIFPVYRQVFSDSVSAQLLKRGSSPNSAARWMAANGNALKSLPLLGQISVAEMANYMQNILLRDTDQMSMAHALEVRVPFLDHDLVSFVLSVPDAHKFPTSPKKLLVDAMGEDLPPEIVHRKKMGFTLPWAEWLKKDLAAMAGDKLNQLGKRNIFHSEGIQALWKGFNESKPNVIWMHIWLLVVLEDWMARNGIE